MSNNHFTFATHALKANSVNIPDPDNNDEITNITDLLPKLQNVENKRIRNIEFLGQLVKVTETSNGIKVYIGEDKNYPAPSASITSLSGTKVASYYLYKTSTPVWPGSQTADWGKTYSNCSTNLKDNNTSVSSSWDKIVISVKGAGHSDNHGSIQGINIPHDESLSITTYRNGVEKTSVISMEQLLGAASAKKYSVDDSIKISWDNMIKLGSDATETGRTPDSVEITNFKITLDPNTMFGTENGGNLYYTIKVDDEVLASRTKADAIYYGVYSSNVSANYTTSDLTPVTRRVSGKDYICDGSSLNLKIDNAVKLTSGGTRKSKKIFDIAVNGGTSKSYDYDNTVLSHTASDSSSDEVSFKNAQTITFNSTGYYGDYTVTPKLYDGNSTSKNITASNSSKSNTLTSATNKAWANPKNSVSDMSESFAHSDNHTNADMKTKRLNPNNPNTEWSWNASTDAPTVPTENSDGSGKLTGVAGGERSHIRWIYSSDTSSTGKFKITFDKATNWTDTTNIKVFCAKYDPDVTDYNKLVWLMINCKQGNYEGGIEGICKETVSNTIKEFNCDIPASLGSFAKNQGLFIKIALTGASSTVYPYTVTFL